MLNTKKSIEGQPPLVVRINGTLPDISTLGSEEKSERAAVTHIFKSQETMANLV